jgi:hypothetical protein
MNLNKKQIRNIPKTQSTKPKQNTKDKLIQTRRTYTAISFESKGETFPKHRAPSLR